MTQPISEPVSEFYRGCDRCFSGRGTVETGMQRPVMGGDGAMCQVVLCQKCAGIEKEKAMKKSKGKGRGGKKC